MINLFKGSGAASPAEAMAAWRRATGEHEAVGKPLQAVAAIFNPAMVREWRALDGARLDLAVEGARPGPLWGFVAPRDDGAIASVITALRLSGGADEPPILDPPIAVERLGETNGALAARLSGAAVFANHRDMLAAEIQRLRAGPADPAPPALFKPDDSGFAITMRPDRVVVDPRVAPGLDRLAATARGFGLVAAHGKLGLDGDRLRLVVVSQFEPQGEGVAPGESAPALDPSWLAWFPERQTAAAAAIALGTGAEFWDGLFQVADAIDRAERTRADLAPLRTRLNFLGLARGVRLEADLWPLLRGASVGALIDEAAPAELRGAVVALHAANPESARRILDRVVSPLASLAGGVAPKVQGEAAGAAEAPRPLGRISGRPLEAIVKDSTVLVGWGDGALTRSLQSAEKPDESLAALLKKKERGDDGRALHRFGVVWPDRAALALGAVGPHSPLAAALTGAAPVVWRGGWSGAEACDAAEWPELRGVVARFLEQIPQAPFETP